MALRKTGQRFIGITPAGSTTHLRSFFRSDPGSLPSSGRHGLGLSIVAAIVRRHHGQILLWPQALVPESVFSVKLPIAG